MSYLQVQPVSPIVQSSPSIDEQSNLVPQLSTLENRTFDCRYSSRLDSYSSDTWLVHLYHKSAPRSSLALHDICATIAVTLVLTTMMISSICVASGLWRSVTGIATLSRVRPWPIDCLEWYPVQSILGPVWACRCESKINPMYYSLWFLPFHVTDWYYTNICLNSIVTNAVYPW